MDREVEAVGEAELSLTASGGLQLVILIIPSLAFGTLSWIIFGSIDSYLTSFNSAQIVGFGVSQSIMSIIL